MTPKTYRKKQLSEATATIKYVDSQGNHRQFKSTKQMLQSHKMLMQNNPFIKSFEVQL
jgi:hypothetical protein